MIPKYFTSNYENEIAYIHQNYPDVHYIDMKEFALSDLDYGDYHHVNKKGAKKVSQWLFEKLKSN